MVEWALYLDESGDTDKHSMPVRHGEKPVFTLGGVTLPIDRWRLYDREYLALKTTFFQNEINSSSRHAALWEFKGNRAIGPRNAESQRIKVFIYKVLDLIMTYGGGLFAVNILKDHERPTAPQSMYTVALQILAEKFNIFLREEGGLGIFIIDSRMAHVTPGRGLDYAVAVSLLTYIFGHERGRAFTQLVEAPLFADSSLTAGLQIADIVAALLYANAYKYNLAPSGADASKGYLDYTHTQRYWPQINELEFKSKQKYNGFQMFGFRTSDHRK